MASIQVFCSSAIRFLFSALYWKSPKIKMYCAISLYVNEVVALNSLAHNIVSDSSICSLSFINILMKISSFHFEVISIDSIITFLLNHRTDITCEYRIKWVRLLQLNWAVRFMHHFVLQRSFVQLKFQINWTVLHVRCAFNCAQCVRTS